MIHPSTPYPHNDSSLDPPCVPKASVVSDMLVFEKIKQRLGGRVRIIVSGGAPLAPAIEEFLKVTMCAPVVQVGGATICALR